MIESVSTAEIFFFFSRNVAQVISDVASTDTFIAFSQHVLDSNRHLVVSVYKRGRPTADVSGGRV